MENEWLVENVFKNAPIEPRDLVIPPDTSFAFPFLFFFFFFDLPIRITNDTQYNLTLSGNSVETLNLARFDHESYWTRSKPSFRSEISSEPT